MMMAEMMRKVRRKRGIMMGGDKGTVQRDRSTLCRPGISCTSSEVTSV